jgi:hypothetical protein
MKFLARYDTNELIGLVAEGSLRTVKSDPLPAAIIISGEWEASPN